MIHLGFHEFCWNHDEDLCNFSLLLKLLFNDNFLFLFICKYYNLIRFDWIFLLNSFIFLITQNLNKKRLIITLSDRFVQDISPPQNYLQALLHAPIKIWNPHTAKTWFGSFVPAFKWLARIVKCLKYNRVKLPKKRFSTSCEINIGEICFFLFHFYSLMKYLSAATWVLKR